jgi:DNA-binding transcriptional ArsR family regulator
VVQKVAASRSRSTREQLRHLAVVFKVEIRLKIVLELFVREMSPKEFYEEFGGGSVSRVSQHFTVLEKHGWLRRVGLKGREGKRRGRPETLYRATEAAFFDTEMWGLLPYSLRLACSWSILKVIAGGVREGMEVAVSEGRPMRDLSCTQVTLEPSGWTRVNGELGLHFESVFAEQEDTRIRVARSGEAAVRVGILQIGFESPLAGDLLSPGLAEGAYEPPIPFPERLAPIFADDLSLEILAALNDSDISVPRLQRELAPGVSEWAVRYRFDRLRQLGWIAVVDKVRRRGAYEQIFRATKPALADNGPWATAPKVLKETENWAAFSRLCDLAKEAIAVGTFDIRYDRHVSWSVVHLDREGWNNVVAGLEALEAFIREEEKQAQERIEAGADPLTMVVGLGAFESPSGRVKAP